MTVEGSSHSEEERKDQPKIRTSRRLAELLELERNPHEKPTSDRRTYEKAFSKFQIQVGEQSRDFEEYEFLAFEDRGRYSVEKGEDISYGIRIGEQPVSKLSREISAENLEGFDATPYWSEKLNAFSKPLLKESGYSRLYPILKSLKEQGYTTELAEKIKTEMTADVTAYYERVNDILVPKVAQYFPELSVNTTNYFEHTPSVFIAPEESYTPYSLILMLEPEYVTIDYSVTGKDKRQPHRPTHPPFDRMPKDRVHYGWVFDEEDVNGQKRQTLDDALLYLKNIITPNE